MKNIIKANECLHYDYYYYYYYHYHHYYHHNNQFWAISLVQMIDLIQLMTEGSNVIDIIEPAQQSFLPSDRNGLNSDGPLGACKAVGRHRRPCRPEPSPQLHHRRS